VFVSEDGIVLFDWPQATPTDHENARELLDRDVANIVGYFQRKYPGDVPEADLTAVADAVAADELRSIEDY